MDSDPLPLSQASSTYDGYTRQFKDPVHDYSTINKLYLGLKGSLLIILRVILPFSRDSTIPVLHC